MYLTGQADAWYQTQKLLDAEYFWAWDVATDAFIARFDNDAHRGAAELELENLKRGDESIIDWNAKIHEKIEHAFANEPLDARLAKQRLYFKKGLSPHLQTEYNKIYLAIRAAVHQVIVDQVSTIDIAIQMTAGTLGQNEFNSRVLSNSFEELCEVCKRK